MKYAPIQVGTMEWSFVGKTLAISGDESFVSPDANGWFLSRYRLISSSVKSHSIGR